MGYVIFEKHPGDLLIINNLQKQIVSIEIGVFRLQIIGPIKLTPQKTFKVNLKFPSNKTSRESFIKILNYWLVKKEIIEYSPN